MALVITHTTVASDPQSPLLGASEWNANHTVGGTVDPTQNNVSVDGVTITGDGTPGSPLVAASGVIFDHYADAGNVGTGEDDLYSDTLASSVLGTNGDKVQAQYCAVLASSATATRQLRAYFGGTVILDSGALTFASGGTAEIWITIIRESSAVVRVCAELVPSGITLQPIVTYTRITGLTLTNTQILKITGEAAGAGAATDDIIAKLGYVEWKSAI